MEKCFIFGSGEYDDIAPDFSQAGFIIAADGGYSWLKEHGKRPDLLVGDFDSLDKQPDGIPTVRYPSEKDDTDMALSVREGEKRGFKEFLIFGGLGGRLDHTFANIQLIVGLSRRGLSAVLVSGENSVTAISNCGLCFDKSYSGLVSVFAFGGRARGIWERELKYTLSDAEMPDDVTLGASNEFLGVDSQIEVREGTLIIMWHGNLDKPLPRLYNQSKT
ncbi:MAG: thiamine diphosphokinase [Oscillospiraceae bacterium]